MIAEPTTAAEVIANIKAVRARLGMTPSPKRRIAVAPIEPKVNPVPIEVPATIEPEHVPGIGVQTAQIRVAVAKHYGVSVNEVVSLGRKYSVVRRRHVAIYLTRKRIKSMSLPQIGRAFGVDHTTILNAVRRIEERMVTDHSLADDIEKIICLLDGAPATAAGE